MKKLALLILLVSGIVVNARAQAVKYSVSAGFTYPKFSYQPDFASHISDVNEHPVLSFSINAGVDLTIFHHLSLQAKIGYLRSGFRLDYQKLNIFGPVHLIYSDLKSLKYYVAIQSPVHSQILFKNLQISALLKYQPSDLANVYILAGPAINYSLRVLGKHKSYTVWGQSIPEQKQSLNSVMHHFNISLYGGLGYEFHTFKSLTPYIEATYSLGLTNLVKSGQTQQFDPFATQTDWRQHAIELKMGVLF